MHKGMDVCVERNVLEARRAESNQSVNCAAARRGPSGESKDAISHHKESERSGWNLMVDMTKHPLHYSRELVMVLLSLDLRPLETVNMIITYSSGLLQKVARGLAFSTMSCGQHPLQGSTLLLSSYRSHLSLRMACGS